MLFVPAILLSAALADDRLSRRAPDAPPAWVLLDSDLTPHPGSIGAITTSGVDWLAPDGVKVSFAPGRVVALVRAAEWSPEPTTVAPPAARTGLDAAEAGGRLGAIELTDGSRIVGSLLPKPVAGEVVAWTHPTLGRITFPLDHARRIALDAEFARWREPFGPVEVRGTRDSVLLTNGDRLEGFVAAVQTSPADGQPDPEAHLRIEIDGQGRLIPLARIREVRLVNPPRTSPPAPPVRVWVGEGSIVAAASVESSDGSSIAMTLEREPAKPGQWSLEADSIRAILLDAKRLTPLSAIAIASSEPWAGRRWAPPPRPWEGSASDRPAVLGAADVILPGPMVVRWTLPQGAARIAGWLLLPDDAREWGDCIVSVKLGDREVFRQRLSSDKPAARLEASIPQGVGSLTIAVEPGEFGPIQDKVVLRRVVIAGPAPSAP